MKPNKVEQKLKRFREIIPAFQCEPGCHDCCGPVPGCDAERAKYPDKPFGSDEQLLHDIKQGKVASCRLLGEQGCTVYADRPLICRMFGTVDNPAMRCPKGKGPKKMMPRQIEADIMRFMREVPHEIV